ncbi:MAG: hypothetical protein AAGC74_04780 [Verrucomicrobiota bacterium]
MKNTTIGLAASTALALTSLTSHGVEVLVPDGDFSQDPTTWVFQQEDVSSAVNNHFTVAQGGGNPDAYCQIDDDGGDGPWALLVANNDATIDIATIGAGLTAGKIHTFLLDMRIAESTLAPGTFGTNVGGLKVEFYDTNGTEIANTGDRFTTPADTPTDWNTYDFPVYIPPGTTDIKIYCLWGEGSLIDFDNIRINDVPEPDLTAVPNKDFATPDGANWGVNEDNGNVLITFPAADGADGATDGYARFDNFSTGTGEGSGFGVLVANDENIIPLAPLGLVEDFAYDFTFDSINFNGPNIAGIKVEFFNNLGAEFQETPDLRPDTTGFTIIDWNTYTVRVPIPVGTEGIKVVPLWGVNSDVGIDNICFSTTQFPIEAVTTIPNADFEAGNADWAFFGDTGVSVSFPATGGSGDNGGYAQIDNSAGGWGGVLVSNSGGTLDITDLGLAAGNYYEFKMDMRIISGTNIGGLKIECLIPDGTEIFETADTFPDPSIVDPTEWKEYTFTFPIPKRTTSLKVVPLWGAGSIICYDNISVNLLSATPIDVLPDPGFEDGIVNWKTQGGGSTAFTFPETGGNPNGYMRVDALGGEFGVGLANFNIPIFLTDLGLAGGDTVDVSVDMRTEVAGTNLGGIKLEYFNGFVGGFPNSTEPDTFPDPQASTDTNWDTYTFQFTIPVDLPENNALPVDGIKIIPLWGANSVVCFDNVTIQKVTTTPSSIEITSCGFDGMGNFTITVNQPVAGLKVTSADDLDFTNNSVDVTTTDDGANTFTIAPSEFTSTGDFFRVEEVN